MRRAADREEGEQGFIGILCSFKLSSEMKP